MAVLRYRHRDRGRPLSEQRRPVGGIGGGGDTPVPQTHNVAWFLPGTTVYAIGKVENKTLSIYVSSTAGQQANTWVIGQDGNVIASTGRPLDQSYYDNVLKPKLDNLGIETTNVTWLYKIFVGGETIPEWDTYVKVE